MLYSCMLTYVFKLWQIEQTKSLTSLHYVKTNDHCHYYQLTGLQLQILIHFNHLPSSIEHLYSIMTTTGRA